MSFAHFLLYLYLFFVNNKNNTLYFTVNVESRTVNIESTKDKTVNFSIAKYTKENAYGAH